jgi:hypothetical protein
MLKRSLLVPRKIMSLQMGGAGESRNCRVAFLTPPTATTENFCEMFINKK